MTDLVTGATGHLGANLVRRLLDEDRRVRVLLRPSGDDRGVAGLDVERVEGDLRDGESIVRAVQGCERVYHCAAKVSTASGGEEALWQTNVLGTRNVLLAARLAGVSRVVVSGSFSAVGTLSGRPSDETVPFDPFAAALPYERSKAAAEHECLKAVAEGLPVVIATSCAILGGNDFKPSRMGKLLLDFARGRLHAYVSGGFEFVAARDIVEGHRLAMEKGRAGQKYIFSTQYQTLEEVLAMFAHVTGKPMPRWRLPAGPLLVAATAAESVRRRLFPEAEPRFTPGAIRLLQMRRRADCGKARVELGYRPTSVAQAVAEAYAWFREKGML